MLHTAEENIKSAGRFEVRMRYYVRTQLLISKYTGSVTMNCFALVYLGC